MKLKNLWRDSGTPDEPQKGSNILARSGQVSKGCAGKFLAIFPAKMFSSKNPKRLLSKNLADTMEQEKSRLQKSPKAGGIYIRKVIFWCLVFCFLARLTSLTSFTQ